MSGPPPCTMTGLRPTYLRRTTSVAKASRRASSRIAAPPYLMTTVRPWNSRMYGSASRSVSTLALTQPLLFGFGPGPHLLVRASASRRVLRVELHIIRGEVREVHVRGALAALEAQSDLGLGVVAAERDGVDVVGSELGQLLARRGHSGRLCDPPPVGVAPVQGGLDERRVGDCARHPLGLVVVLRTGHLDAAHAACTLSVGDDLERE